MAEKTIKARSIDTQLLIDFLSPEKIAEGQVVTYDSLSKCVGRDVRRDAYPNLYAARRYHRNRGIVYEAVHGKGLKRCNDVEKVLCGLSSINRARRAAKRGMQTITSVEKFDELPADMKVKHHFGLACLGTIAYFGSNKAEKVIEKKIEATKERLSLTKTIELFTVSE